MTVPTAAVDELAALVTTVQHNCDLADALHAREQGLCTYLLAMRELYRWAVDAPLGSPLPRDAVGAWIADRERHWERLLDDGAGSPRFRPLPLEGGIDPFDESRANEALIRLCERARARPLRYGAGLGRHRAPLFFVAEIVTSTGARAGARDAPICVTERELARGVTAPPAATRGSGIVIRRDALRRWLWTRTEGARLRAPGDGHSRADAFVALLARYGAGPGGEGAHEAIERLVDTQTATLILHEQGELAAGALLGADWERMLSEADRRTELVLRAARDLLADALVTLPTLFERGDDDAVAFWCANLEGLRRTLANDGADDATVTDATLAAQVAARAEHWHRLCVDLRDVWRRAGAPALAQAVARLIP